MRTLHKMLHEVACNQAVSMVSSIFFNFLDYAVTEDQKNLLETYMRTAVEKICYDTKLRELIMDAVELQNQTGSQKQLLKEIRIENTLAGYFPKLPYLKWGK